MIRRDEGLLFWKVEFIGTVKTIVEVQKILQCGSMEQMIWCSMCSRMMWWPQRDYTVDIKSSLHSSLHLLFMKEQRKWIWLMWCLTFIFLSVSRTWAYSVWRRRMWTRPSLVGCRPITTPSIVSCHGYMMIMQHKIPFVPLTFLAQIFECKYFLWTMPPNMSSWNIQMWTKLLFLRGNLLQ